jgi:acetyltransferase-like isoleucine patch superfamily enzyme
MADSFLSATELQNLGLNSYGKNVLISRKASIFGANLINIGDNVRIDDFCILSGRITIGSYVHISAYTALYGKSGIDIADFVTISGRVLVYSENDDYSGEFMTNPMLPHEYTNVQGARVVFEKHSIVASGCIVLPGVILGEGSCAGAMSLVKNNLEPWTIYAGVPAKRKKDRSKNIIELENRFRKSL